MYKRKSLVKIFKRIRRLYPKAGDIDIDVQAQPDGQYKTKMEVKTPMKNLVVTKKDNSYIGSVDKSFDAMRKLIEKTKWKSMTRI